MKYLLALLPILLGCGPDPVFDATFTKDKLIGPDEVRAYRATLIEKKGWLTSDRYVIYLADGSVEVLNGKWEVVLTPVVGED